MRLKSSIYVSALLRQINANGGFATVLNKGAEEAGAIFIVHLKSRDEADFYGPAPQAFFDAETSGERVFELLGEGLPESEIATRTHSQIRFDADCWIVELDYSGELPEMVQLVTPE